MQDFTYDMAHLQSCFAVCFIRHGNMGVVVDIAVEHAREEQKGEGAEWGIVGCCA